MELHWITEIFLVLIAVIVVLGFVVSMILIVRVGVEIFIIMKNQKKHEEDNQKAGS